MTKQSGLKARSPRPKSMGLAMTALAVAGVSVFSTFAEARVGLMTTFVDVVLNRLNAGGSYDVAKLSGDRFALTNRGGRAVRVAVEVEAPAAEALEAGYEPLPEARWVEVSPATLEIAPGETRIAKVTLRIPKDARWKGRHFQAALWSRLTGETLAAGVRSRLFFSVESTGPGLAARATVLPAVKLEPETVNLEKVPSGKRVPARLTLVNESDDTISVSLRSAPCVKGADWPAGFEPASAPEFLVVPREAVSLRPGEKHAVPLEFALPAGRAHAGRRYGFVVRAELADGTLLSASEVFAVMGGKP